MHLAVIVINDFLLSFEGFFVPGFPKLLRFQDHHDRILKKLLSRLFKILVSVNFKLVLVKTLSVQNQRF